MITLAPTRPQPFARYYISATAGVKLGNGECNGEKLSNQTAILNHGAVSQAAE
jgi:hypothetical protein